MAVASGPVTAWKMTPPAAAASNTPSKTTQWKWRCGLRVEPKRDIALKLHKEGRVRRVGILDCDYHYGDGTEDLIRHHSLSRWLRHVTAEKHYQRHAARFLSRLPALVRSFAGCDVLLYQAGADPHIDDPFGGFLTNDQLAQRDAIVFAETKAMNLPVVWNLAGGYQEPLQKVLDIHDRTMEACIAALR
jgi:acetoin utilization deacetylase AcuC-like enzyme